MLFRLSPLADILFPSYPVTELCRVLRAAYPSGDGSIAILRTLPKSRCVRWRCRCGATVGR
jgi:hypothetical protein